MADTIRRRILTEIVAALSETPPTGVPIITTLNRRELHEKEEMPAMSVYPTTEKAEVIGGAGGPVTRRRLTFLVSCWASGTDTDAALDPMLAWVTKTLNGQRVMDGATQISHEIEEIGTEWDDEQLEFGMGQAIVELVVSYSTKVNDQEVLS